MLGWALPTVALAGGCGTTTEPAGGSTRAATTAALPVSDETAVSSGIEPAATSTVGEQAPSTVGEGSAVIDGGSPARFVDGVAGRTVPYIERWAPAVTGALLWPLVLGTLDRMRQGNQARV